MIKAPDRINFVQGLIFAYINSSVHSSEQKKTFFYKEKPYGKPFSARHKAFAVILQVF